jgi:hypothetical protein
MTCQAERFPSEREYKSLIRAFVAGTDADFPLDFFDTPLRTMAAPYITRAFVKFDVPLVTAASTGALRSDSISTIVNRLFLKDGSGERYDITGMEWLNHVKREYNARNVWGPNLGAGASETRSVLMPLVIEPQRMCPPGEGRNYRWDLRDFRNGEVTIGWVNSAYVGDPTTGTQRGTIGAATAQLILRVIDEGTPTLKTRMVVKGYLFDSAKKTLPVDARVRTADMYIGSVAENKATPDTWASQKVTSDALDLKNVPTSHLEGSYYFAANDEAIRMAPDSDESITDPVANGFIIPLVQPTATQPMTEMPSVPSLDVETDLTYGSGTFTAANGPRIVGTYIVDRPGCSPLAAGGTVKTSDGRSVPVAAVAPELAGKLPVKGAASPGRRH